MNFIAAHIKKNKLIFLIVLLFLAAKILIIFNYKEVWWDSAVYIGMGKYIYSLGSSGLWEDSRPIVWPLMLGFLWKSGLNPVLFGRIIEIFLGGMCILLTYLVGRKLLNVNAGLLASAFLALSPLFFFFNGIMLTEVISTFFSLLAVYFFIEKKQFISGAFFGIAFITRFLQLLIFTAALLCLLVYYGKKNTRDMQKIFLGFILAAAPFLILNQVLYNNVFFPFLQQILLSENSGWLNYNSLSYYFIGLFNENFLYLLSVFGIFLLFRSKDKAKAVIPMAFLLAFAFFNSIRQKEMRFLIILLPYLCLLMASSISHFFSSSKSKIFKSMLIGFVVVSLLLPLKTAYAYHKDELNKGSQYNLLQEKLAEAPQGTVWASNPIISVHTDRKIAKLMYYPSFNYEKNKELISDSEKAGFIFIDFCDLACRPDDALCDGSKKELEQFFKKKFIAEYSSVKDGCSQYVFKQQNSTY